MLVAADSAEQPRNALLNALAEICVEALAEEKVQSSPTDYSSHLLQMGHPPYFFETHALHYLITSTLCAQNGGRGLKQSLLAPSEKKRLDQILRSAVMQLVAGSVAAGAPLMHWRAAGGSDPPTLQRLLEMLLSVCEEPTFDSGVRQRCLIELCERIINLAQLICMSY